MRAVTRATVTTHTGFAMLSRRTTALAHRVLGIWCLAVLATAAAGGARAASEIYTVRPVSVDVTAESAAAAREQALANAHERAFQRLIARIVPKGAHARVADVGYDKVATLVRDFEVANEKTSSVRYLADLTIRFQRSAVREFLRANDVPFAETRSQPVLVLPLHGAAGDVALWRDPNPWRDAWADYGGDAGLVPLEVPLGDLTDMEAISARAALDQRTKPLGNIAARYAAEDVLVTQAIPAGNASQGTASAQIISRRVGEAGQENTWIRTVEQRAQESREAMYARAVEQVAAAVERAWKLANVVRFESEASLTARVPIDGLERWVTVRKRLDSVPVIGNRQVRTLSRERADVQLVYYGDLRQLRRALGQAGLVLEETASGAADGGDAPDWTVRLPAAGDAGGGRTGGDGAE